jgi:hypothetical protein
LEEDIMRKLFLLVAAAVLMSALPLSQSFAQAPPPVPVQHHHHHYWIPICGLVSAASVMVGSEVQMNNPDAARGRQLTITEATWWASACPLLLPLALVSTATCPDNKATVEVARLAYLYTKKRPGADQGAFTIAYTEACREGRLSRVTRRTLLKLAG